MNRYTASEITKAVVASKTVAEVVRRIGGNDRSGGLVTHITGRMRSLGLDTNHFVGKTVRKGQPHPNKKTWQEHLIRKSAVLTSSVRRRALLESGREEKCEVCGLGPVWNKKSLVLPIDHINGDRLDDRRKNLRFLCPNCHAQTPTFGYKNAKKHRKSVSR